MVKHVLYRDIETRSTVDLPKVGAHHYAAHGATEVLVVGYAVDDEPVQLWHPDDDDDGPPDAFYQAANNPDWIAVAHNVNFERLIERHVLAPRYGLPVIPIEKQHCTMAMSQALALPASLEGAAKSLNLISQKDKNGTRIMKRLARPRRARVGEDPNETHWDDDEIKLAELDDYCIIDVETTRELYQSLPPLLDQEQELWQLDARINDRGFAIDRDLIRSAIKIAETAYPLLNAEIAQITNGAVSSFNQVAKLTTWLNNNFELNINVLDKKAIDELLLKPLPDVARKVLELRLQGAQAAVKKLAAIWNRRELDARVRGAFMYHAAGTGRWSSRGVQVHNLKRMSLSESELEEAISTIATGDYEQMHRRYSNPLAVIGGCIRAVICSAEGKVLLGADFSGIEARVTAWVAGEKKKLEIFRQFDASTGPDPYAVAAMEIFECGIEEIDKSRRQVGKVAELAFGYQGGVGAFRKFGTDREFTDDEIETIKQRWRAAHPNIERFWHSVNRAVKHAVKHPGDLVRCGKVAFKYRNDGSLPFLWLVLPSGRRLAYPNARLTRANSYGGKIVESENGEACVLFKDNSAGQWRDVRVYGGLITENIVQAIARDLLAEAMLRIEAAGFEIVTHVHDEIVVELPENHDRKLEFDRLMTVVPDWCAGLPIAAKSWTSTRYVK